MKDSRTLLLIDGDPVHAKVFETSLLNSPDGPFRGEWIRSLTDGLRRVQKKGVWAIFLNLRLSGGLQSSVFDKFLLEEPRVQILVLAGADDELIALEALRHGAKDYLLEGHIDSYSFIRAIRQIAEREVADEVLFSEKQRAQTTLDSIGDGVLCTDILGKVTYLNAVAEAMIGWPTKEAIGRPLPEVFEIVDGATRKPMQDPLHFAIKNNKTMALAANCVLIRRDGYETAIEDSAAPIHDRFGNVTGAVIVFHDMAISRMRAGEMKHLAEHDVLTDLPNRLLLTDRLNQAIASGNRYGKELAVLFLDLDHFKKLNDSFGHVIADKLLQSVAARLINCVRSSDTVSRYGGDEFVILLSEIGHAHDAHVTAIKILKALARPYEIDQHSLSVTSSIGISTHPLNGSDAERLIKNADTAMYHAKQNGRNNYQFFKSDCFPPNKNNLLNLPL
jgi:diguanylate cyclase (GGDEF)-like protein/PAS domain S-box-containing protein